MKDWRLLSNHGLTLICLARNPEMTLREIGDWVGVTERTAHEITKELVADGYLSRSKERGRNRYTVHPEMPLRHPEMPEHDVGEMLSMLAGGRWTPPDGNSGDSGKPAERRRKGPRKSEKSASPQGRRRAPGASQRKKG
jgi:hypothetical protein